MSNSAPRNFFALVEDFEIRLLDVSKPLQIELTEEFAGQRRMFFEQHPGQVAFEADYTPDELEMLYIEGFQLPANMRSALQNPLSVQHLTDEELPAVRGLFTGSPNGKQISLQVFDRRRLLSTRGFSLTLHKGTFRKLTDGGLTLDTKLAAAVEDNRLYFHSFALARRLFDLSDYFREATDADLATFAEHKAVLFDDPGSLTKNADSWVRKKVALILQNGILERERPAKIASTAQTFGLLIEVQTVARRDKLRFPSEKKRLKEMLHFLDEDYLTSILTGTNFLSNSKRRLDRTADRRPASGASTTTATAR